MNILVMSSELPASDGQQSGLHAAAKMPEPSTTISLSDLPVGQSATISSVLTASEEDRELVLRLIEIGLIPGEKVRVIAQGRPGREPIALRIGGATGGASFALRRFEANYIRVIPESVYPPAA